MKREILNNEYESPRVDFLCVVVEKGFAGSNDWNPEQDEINYWG